MISTPTPLTDSRMDKHFAAFKASNRAILSSLAWEDAPAPVLRGTDVFRSQRPAGNFVHTLARRFWVKYCDWPSAAKSPSVSDKGWKSGMGRGGLIQTESNHSVELSLPR